MASNPPEPVPVADRVYDAIYAAVIDHRLVPGSRLREEELAQAFSVSRTLVRQALRKLVEAEARATPSRNKQEAIRLSGEFHLQLAAMARNAPLAQFLNSLVPLTSLIIAQYEAKACTYCAWQEHEAIVDAVEQRDVNRAMNLMTQHLDHLEAKLLSHDGQMAHPG